MAYKPRRFEGKVVVITGVCSPIGTATALAFAREGATTALVSRRANHLALLVLEVRAAAGQALVVTADLADVAALPHVAGEILGRFGQVDVLVNAAGLEDRRAGDRGPYQRLTEALRLNLIAPVVLAGLMLPRMRTGGGGTVVSVVSLAEGVPTRAAALPLGSLLFAEPMVSATTMAATILAYAAAGAPRAHAAPGYVPPRHGHELGAPSGQPSQDGACPSAQTSSAVNSDKKKIALA